MQTCELVHQDPEVYRVRVPLPRNALREMNSYIVRDGEEILVIDTGFEAPECLDVLKAAFAELGFSAADACLFVTHSHADHCGSVGLLPFRRTYAHADANAVMRDVASGAWNKIQAATTLEMGFTQAETELILEESPSSNQRNKFEFTCRTVADGEELKVGRHAFTCVHTPGHAPGHLCLYLAERGLLFTGDHVLFDISPNIAHWVVSADPLQDYLDNLRAVRDMPVTLALPGHREPRREIASRVDELLRHHDMRLKECLCAVAACDGQVACDIATRITWSRGRLFQDMGPTQRLFAAGEARAHVEHLVREGQVMRERVDGLVRYTAK